MIIVIMIIMHSTFKVVWYTELYNVQNKYISSFSIQYNNLLHNIYDDIFYRLYFIMFTLRNCAISQCNYAITDMQLYDEKSSKNKSHPPKLDLNVVVCGGGMCQSSGNVQYLNLGY